MNGTRCGHCPVDRQSGCVGACPGSSHYCQFAALGPEQAGLVALRSTAPCGPDGGSAITPLVTFQVSTATVPVSPTPRSGSRYAPTTGQVASVNLCPHRECRTGCQKSVCHAGRGDYWGQVSMAECVKCIQTGWYAYESGASHVRSDD